MINQWMGMPQQPYGMQQFAGIGKPHAPGTLGAMYPRQGMGHPPYAATPYGAPAMGQPTPDPAMSWGGLQAPYGAPQPPTMAQPTTDPATPYNSIQGQPGMPSATPDPAMAGIPALGTNAPNMGMTGLHRFAGLGMDGGWGGNSGGYGRLGMRIERP